MLSNAQREASATTIQNSEFSMSDFRQSYVVGRVAVQAPTDQQDKAEDQLFWQIERIEEIKIQIDKFRRDLGTIRGQPIVTKTVENLNLLKVDFDRTMEQLKSVRVRIQEEQQALLNHESSLQNTIDTLRYQQESFESELEALANQNKLLERKIENIKSDNSSATVAEQQIKNLKIELADTYAKMEEVEATLRRTEQELDLKEKQVFDQRRQIESLKTNLETLAGSVDEPTSQKIRQSIRQADTQEDFSDDEVDLANTASKKDLLAENKKLQKELEEANSKLEEMSCYVSKLRIEIAELTKSLEEAEESRKIQDNPTGFNLEELRMSQMMSLYKEANSALDSGVVNQRMSVALETQPEPVEPPKQEETPQVIPEPIIIEREVPILVEKPVYVEKIVEKVVEVVVEKIVEVKDTEELERLEQELKTALVQAASSKESAKNKEIQLGMLEQKASRMTRELEDSSKREQGLETQIQELKSELEVLSKPAQTSELPSEDAKRQEEQKMKEFAILKNTLEQLKIELAWYKNNSQKHPQTTESKDPTLEMSLQPTLRDSFPLSTEDSQVISVATPTLHQSIYQDVETLQIHQKAPVPVVHQSVVSSVESFHLMTPNPTPLLDSKLSQSALGQSTLSNKPKTSNPKAIKLSLYNKELLKVQQSLKDAKIQVAAEEAAIEELRQHPPSSEVESKILERQHQLEKVVQTRNSYLNIEKEIKLNIAKCLDELQTTIMAESGMTQPIISPSPPVGFQTKDEPTPQQPTTAPKVAPPFETLPSDQKQEKAKVMTEKLSNL